MNSEIECFIEKCLILENEIHLLFEKNPSSDKVKISVLTACIIKIVKLQENKEASFNQLIKAINHMFEKE